MADDDENNKQNDSHSHINYKSICCKEIPELFLDKLVAKRHFSKFGKINRFILRPKRLSCNVEYETEEDAERAYMESGHYNGIDFLVEYAEREVAHVQNTEEWVDPDVQSELEAMNPGGGQRMSSMRPPPQPKLMSSRIAKPMAAPIMAQKPPPRPPNPPEVVKVDATVRNELEAVLRRPGYTDEEKYRILDARDKLIRLRTVRQTDIKTAVSTKGTCPDMCPEKERLMREFQRQVSSFEMSEDAGNSSSTISHRRAIKEYSRSSADQEVPLGHELRSESVLHMTMLYLMHCIMDLCDDPQTSLADWFHFVWDRTRSIRKDITQQELCSLGAVQLVEQCARFHVHCAARLVAEDPSVFDKKINAENLTKCLQTLKYMYHDLRIKGIPCPCEAEFRSYIVLLNLGDANFLWELKQLPEHVQNSRAIKRAIAFYNALQNNNYVRFFSMIRSPETSYLSACILLGYFNKFRERAMEVIVKAHNWRKNVVLVPVAYISRVLGFESNEAAGNFLSCHGLKVDEQARVTLERLTKPDTEYSMDREIELVESKRTVSVGECVYGHPLESADIFERHQPHNSFDANGLLKSEAWTAEDQLRGEEAKAKAMQIKQQQQPQPPTIKADSNIFKVPQASPSTSPKQLQQQKLQQQTSMPPPPSIFGGPQFGGNVKTPSPQRVANFKFGSDSENSDGNTDRPFESISETTKSPLFKMPLGKGISPKPAPTSSTSSSAYFNSIFKPSANADKPEPQTSGNIFGGSVTIATPGGSNIFGTAAKETANIFQQQIQKPEPLRSDNVFQHFQTQAPDFGAHTKTNKSIFGGAVALDVEATKRLGSDTKTQEEQQRRLLELKQEQEELLHRKQKELEHERQKLKELEEKRKSELAHKQAIQELEARAEKETQLQLGALLGEAIAEIAHSELTQYRVVEDLCLEVFVTLLGETVREEVQEIANEEYAVSCHDQMILNRYFARWLGHTRKKLQQRQLMDSTPIWVTTETRAQQTAQMRHPCQGDNLQLIKRYRHGQPCNFKMLLSAGLHSNPKQPVDLFQIIAKYFASKQTLKNGLLSVRKYFKLLLTLPSEMEELPGFESRCHKWLQKHIKHRESPQENSESSYICSVEHDVGLCVRKVVGSLPLNEQGRRVRHEGDNADAIVFFMTCANLQNTRKRLHHLIKLSSNYKSLPIAFVVYDCPYDEQQLADILELEYLVDDGKISAYKFCGYLLPKSEFHFAENLCKALKFVARESTLCQAEADALEMQSLQSWLESNLGEEMWQRWHASALTNPVFCKVCCMPQHVIGIYNASVKRLQEIVGEDWQDSPEFPVELHDFVPPLKLEISRGLEYFPRDWKNPQRQQQILKFLESLKLPAIGKEESAEWPHDLEKCELWLLNYAGRFIPNDDEKATQSAYEAIKALIKELNAADLQELPTSARLTMINYLPVVKALAFAQINHILETGSKQTCPSEVIYRRQALLDYQLQPWWLNNNAVEAVTVDYSICETRLNDVEAAASASLERSYEELESVIEQAEAISRKTELKLNSLRNETLNTTSCDLTRELEESLHQFEVSKLFGTFDTSFVGKMFEDDIDLEEDGAVGGAAKYHSPKSKQKRKHDDNDMADIMSRAFDLIERVESKQDRLQKSAKLALDEF